MAKVEKRAKIEFEGTEWQTFDAQGKWTSFIVSAADSEGDVEFSMEDKSEGTRSMYLCQEDLKMLIAHLQKQVR